jgi:hypothetical protein
MEADDPAILFFVLNHEDGLTGHLNLLCTLRGPKRFYTSTDLIEFLQLRLAILPFLSHPEPSFTL